MRPRSALARAAGLPAGLLFTTISGVAWALSPWSAGRLLRAAFVPRLREHPLRTTLTIMGIVFGVAAVTAVLLVNRSIVMAAASTVDDIAGKADLQVTAGTAGFDDVVLDDVEHVDGVYKAAPVVEQTALLRDPSSHGDRVLVLGVDLVGSDDRYFRGYGDAELAEVNKDPVAFVDSPYHLLLGQTLAVRLHKRVHDTIVLETPGGARAFEIYGFMRETGLARAFGGSVAMMHYQSMQVAFERGSKIDRIDVAVTPGAPVDPVARALRAKLGAGFGAAPPQERTNHVATMLQSLQAALVCAGLVAAQIGLFLIYNTMIITIVQRKRELGILRALGLTTGQLLRLLTFEGAVLGSVASVLGVGFGIGLAAIMLRATSRTVSEVYVQIEATRVHVDGRLLVGCFVFGVVTTAGSTWVAARSALAIRPTECLRTSGLVEAGRRQPGFSTRDGAGLALLAASVPLLYLKVFQGHPAAAWGSIAALLMGGAALVPRLVEGVNTAFRRLFGGVVGVEVTMANENLPRDLARTSLTAGALMVSVGMATGFAVLVGSYTSALSDWAERNVSADLFVTSTTPGLLNNVSMTSALADKLRAVPGVKGIDRVRIANAEFRGHPFKLVAFDARETSQHSRETPVEGDYDTIVRALEEGDSVAVSENFSRLYNVHAGDSIDLEGQGTVRAYRVAGVMVDYTSDLGAVMIDREAYVKNWGDDLVDMYKIFVTEGASIDAVGRAINERAGDRFDLVVLTMSEWKAQIMALLQRIFSLMRALEAVSLSIAALGVLNAISANVLDRVREIGVLRAIGLQRRQVARMVVAEAVLVGTCGVLAAMMLGFELGNVMLVGVSQSLTGWVMPYAPAWAYVCRLEILVVAVSALAGWYPARQAASLKVTNALAYE
jgi:putative ABC transport system permease protein